MIVVRSIYQNHLVFNCLCVHVGKVAVKDLMLKYGGDTTVEAVERAAWCSRCRGKIFPALRSFMWVVVSLQCIVRIRPRTIKIFNSILTQEAPKSLKYLFFNLNNFLRPDLVPNLILPKNSDTKKGKAPGFPHGTTQGLFTCQTQSGGGCLTIY